MVLVAAVLVGLVSAQVGCTKDTDCKGDRVCEAGRCVNPVQASPPVAEPAPSPPPPPPPAAPPVDASEYPKVVRHDGKVCVQSLGADGNVTESCRTDDGARRPLGNEGMVSTPSSWDEPVAPKRIRRAKKQEPDDAPVKTRGFAADFAALGGILAFFGAGGSVALPEVNLHVALGGRLSPGFGLSGIIDTKFFFGSGGWGAVMTFGPGLRLGGETHVTIAATGGFVYGSTRQGSVFGSVGALIAHLVIPFPSGFGLHLQPALSFDASGVLLSLGGGFGGSVF